MKVQIDVGQLEVGMYVCELDRPWRETPFLFQGFEIRSTDDIRALQMYCRSVYVLLRDDPASAALRRRFPIDPALRAAAPAPRQQALQLEQELFKLNNHPSARSAYVDQTTFTQELERVRDTFRETRHLVPELMADAKLGRSLNLPGARRLVGRMAASVLRNPDALICFAQLKRKHEYTALHSLRVCVLALAFGRQLGLPVEQLELLGLGALLHDIGKARVPDDILDKPGALTPEEFAIMRRHVPWGVEILEGSGGVPACAIDVARCHHERHDGSGYAAGLKGEAITTFGMIGAIVDHYDAITSDRAYRAALSAHTVLRSMYEWRGSLFDAGLVEKFIQCLGIYPIGSVVELNTGEIGVVAAHNRVQRLKPHVVLVQRPDRTPYPDAPLVNLATRRTPQGTPCDVERVLEPADCGIDPVRYLPVVVGL